MRRRHGERRAPFRSMMGASPLRIGRVTERVTIASFMLAEIRLIRRSNCMVGRINIKPYGDGLLYRPRPVMVGRDIIHIEG